MNLGLGFMGAALPLSLTIDSQNQVVGGSPKFTLIGAPPGATVFWSSFKDNVATGEYNASYGQLVEANGTAQLDGGAWTTADVGVWTKTVLIQSPDGTNNTAQVQFRVSPASTPTTPSTPVPVNQAGSFWENPLFTIGDFEVIPAIAGVGLAALYFFTKKR